MLNATQAVYCPARIPDFEVSTRAMLSAFGSRIHRQVLWGGRGELDQLLPSARLYVLAHSHGAASLFSAGTLHWTGAELAALLRRDGLPLGHVNITLLVCRAALSMASRATVARLRGIVDGADRARQRDDQAALEDMKRRYNEIADAAPPAEPHARPGQMVPLAVDLAQAMGALRYHSLTITAFTRPVNMGFNAMVDREIVLELANGQLAAAAAHPECCKRFTSGA